jgi:hypothetical protein
LGHRPQDQPPAERVAAGNSDGSASHTGGRPPREDGPPLAELAKLDGLLRERVIEALSRGAVEVCARCERLLRPPEGAR